MSLLAQTVPARVREFGHINVQENNDAVDNQHMTLLDKYYPQPPLPLLATASFILHALLKLKRQPIVRTAG
ncbi:MAG: hypothetical protein ACI82O_002764 [Patiriisocius sp.]|jgi:hypothetical protein